MIRPTVSQSILTSRLIVVLSVFGRQPRDERLEVVGEAAGVPRERDTLHADPVLGAIQPAQLSAELQLPGPEIEMAPGRLDLLQIVAMRRGEPAQRAPQARRLSATDTTTRPPSNCTRRTQIPSRRSRRENPALTRIVVLLLS